MEEYEYLTAAAFLKKAAETGRECTACPLMGYVFRDRKGRPYDGNPSGDPEADFAFCAGQDGSSASVSRTADCAGRRPIVSAERFENGGPVNAGCTVYGSSPEKLSFAEGFLAGAIGYYGDTFPYVVRWKTQD